MCTDLSVVLLGIVRDTEMVVTNTDPSLIPGIGPVTYYLNDFSFVGK